MKRVWFRTVAISCWFRSVQGQADSLTTLNSNVSFLESGLTTLAVLSAGITVLARADLAYESMLRDWQYTVIDTGTAQITGPDILLVSNLESIGLSLFTTRVFQGAGMGCAVVKWKLADPDNIHCGCILVTCPDSCVEPLQEEWEDQVVLCIENPSKAILLSSNCWIQDVHWNFAKPTRERYVFVLTKLHQSHDLGGCDPFLFVTVLTSKLRNLCSESLKLLFLYRISESEREARAQLIPQQVAMGVQSLLNILDNGSPDIGALLIPLYDQDELVKMIRDEFICRDEASRNRAPRVIGAMLDTRLERGGVTEESLWQTSRWRCFLLHLIEIAVMVSLTVVFTIDPFTSSLAARRVVSGFVASESGGAPYAGHFVDQLRFFKPLDPTSLKYTYVLRCPPIAGIGYLFVIALNLLFWILSVGFWFGRVGGGIPAVLYQSGLYQKKPGILFWALGGLIQALALTAETLTYSHALLGPRKFWRVVVYMFPRVEASTTLLVVAGNIFPPLLQARKEVQLLCSVSTLWLSAVITWVVSVYRSGRHFYNSLAPDTFETCYYAAAFFKLAVITAGSGTWH
jgi:hypothetical protein